MQSPAWSGALRKGWGVGVGGPDLHGGKSSPSHLHPTQTAVTSLLILSLPGSCLFHSRLV